MFYENEPLVGVQIMVTAPDGGETVYTTDGRGWIDGLPIRDIRAGFTAADSPNGNNVYRMYYALENYDYFTPHFFRAQIPLLITLLLSAVGTSARKMTRCA